ncbi:MAG: hypothetical protein JXR40_02780 [Pontiellaceae bacterium]|nr:hypothetical protein [Pontiellaceae bacterium]
MKKLTLLCTASQQEETLKKLRDLQVVHIKHVRAPEGSELEQARNHLLYVQRAKEVLQARPDADPTGKDPHHLVDTVWKLIHKEKELKESLQALEHEHERIQPFGDFEPREIEKLHEQGLFVKLYELPVKNPPEIPEGVAIKEISADKTLTYVLAVGRSEFSIPAHEVRLPDRSLTRIEHHIEKTKAELEETEAEFQKYAGDKHLVEQIVSEAQDGVTFLEARAGMGKENVVTYLSGFYPIDRETDIVSAAEENGWGYTMEDVSDDDEPPTLLRNPKWVQTIKPVLDMVNLMPGYNEVDISPLFLIFFSLFFGILVGDAGYGAIFIAVTTWARFKFKKAPRVTFNLLTVTSISTITWGALTGVWFGILNLPAPLKQLQVTWLSDYYNMMGFCFVVGAVHITLAHLWKAWILRKTPQFIAQIGWIGSTWAMLFVALNMVCNTPFPKFFLPLIAVSVVLIVIFMTPPAQLKAKWIDHGMLFQDLINNFVDVFSYVRLFAVGLATFEVAKAFNGMANGIIAPVVLLVGHTLNIAMAVMGVMVHGLRLNALEFSSHIGVEWKGNKFTPFSKIATKND